MSSVRRRLMESRPSALHVIDPFKVPLSEAIEKVACLERLRFPAVLVGSTDCPNFDGVVAPYVDALVRSSGLPVILHFPPSKERGTPLCASADAAILHCVPCSEDDYFSGPCVTRTLATQNTDNLELLRSASFVFGHDPKTFRAVTAVATPETAEDLEPYVRAATECNFDIIYLYSRHGTVPGEVCRLFAGRRAPDQLLFVSGGICSPRQIHEHLRAGADYVVFGGALEQAEWSSTLASLSSFRSADAY